MSLPKLLILAALAVILPAQAQQAPATSGTLVVVPAYGEVTHANDEAVLVLSIEEFDKDKTAAGSRVNQKMRQGVEIVKHEDPQAKLKTHGYYTYPVYPDNPPPQPRVAVQPKPQPVGWRVGQYLEVKTGNLQGLPRTAAAAQKVLAISSLQFGLSPATTKQLDAERIAATWRNLNERIASIAAAMGRKASDAVIDTVDFEGSGRYAGDGEQAAKYSRVMVTGARRAQEEVSEPSFEPGETTLEMRLVGKVKFR